MKKIALTVLATAFAVSVSAPAFAQKKAKAAPGKCGTYFYYDMKTKKCKDKRG